MNEPITEAEDKAIEEWAWRTFAHFHPVEAYESWPDRFLALVQEQRPDMTRDILQTIINEL